MTDTVKIKYYICTNKNGSESGGEFEVDREDWEAMTDEHKDKLCQEYAFEYMEWGWHEEK